MVEMIGTDVVRDVMSEKGLTQAMLAEMLGYRTASGVSGRLGTQRISVDKMVQMLQAMGYEMIVRKSEPEEGEEVREWKVIG